jgi:acetate CoA/acetoacetate CoA-transferase alpha subunit
MKAQSVSEAVERIPDGASLMIGGFMGVGTPERLIDELVRQGKRGLTGIANDNAMPGRGIGKLISAGLSARTIVSPIGLGPETCSPAAPIRAKRASPRARLRWWPRGAAPTSLPMWGSRLRSAGLRALRLPHRQRWNFSHERCPADPRRSRR